MQITIAEQVLEEPKHFLKARLLEGSMGLRAPGQRGLEGQDLVGERQGKPTGFHFLLGASGKFCTPLPTLPTGFPSWEV